MKVHVANSDSVETLTVKNKPDLLGDVPVVKDIHASGICDNFKPLRITIKLCGFSTQLEHGVRRILCKTYGTLVLISLLGTFARVVYAVVANVEHTTLSNPNFAVSLMVILWLFLSAANGLVMYLSDNSGRLARVCEQVPAVALENSSLKT